MYKVYSYTKQLLVNHSLHKVLVNDMTLQTLFLYQKALNCVNLGCFRVSVCRYSTSHPWAAVLCNGLGEDVLNAYLSMEHTAYIAF